MVSFYFLLQLIINKLIKTTSIIYLFKSLKIVGIVRPVARVARNRIRVLENRPVSLRLRLNRRRRADSSPEPGPSRKF